MTTSQLIAALAIVCVIGAGSYFLGFKGGQFNQAEAYADVVSGAVEILIKGNSQKD